MQLNIFSFTFRCRRMRSTGSRQAPRASSSPGVIVEEAVALVTPGPSTTVFAAPGLIRTPIEVDLTQDSDEEVRQLIN